MGQPVLPDPTALERKVGLIGLPIAHSISPTLHHVVYTAMGKPLWGQVLNETTDLPGTLKQLQGDPTFMGTGVTMPYKVAVIPLLDELTPEACAIGAVNTVYPRPDPVNPAKARYWGTNTDCIGIRDAFLANVPDPTAYYGRPGLVVGGGGTSRAAVYALQHFFACTPIYIINRDAAEVAAVQSECVARGLTTDLIHITSVTEAQSLPPPGAIVSAIPNFTPSTPAEQMVRQILTAFLSQPHKGALLEMCYHPSPHTQIAALAARYDWQVILGTEALIGQGLEQAKLWTGVEITPEILRRVRVAVAEALAKMN
jgi:quinate dehydrogenase